MFFFFFKWLLFCMKCCIFLFVPAQSMFFNHQCITTVIKERENYVRDIVHLYWNVLFHVVVEHHWSVSFKNKAARKQSRKQIVCCKSAGRSFGNLRWKIVLQEMLLDACTGTCITHVWNTSTAFPKHFGICETMCISGSGMVFKLIIIWNLSFRNSICKLVAFFLFIITLKWKKRCVQMIAVANKL